MKKETISVEMLKNYQTTNNLMPYSEIKLDNFLEKCELPKLTKQQKTEYTTKREMDPYSKIHPSKKHLFKILFTIKSY